VFGIIIVDLLTPTAATSAAAPTAAKTAAPATAAERPLLSERPALRAALRELPSLASTAHITKGTT
jgi:hypothetical protein